MKDKYDVRELVMEKYKDSIYSERYNPFRDKIYNPPQKGKCLDVKI